MGQVTTTVYAQVVPKFGQRYNNGSYETVVEKITVAAITQSRPKQPAKNSVVVKLALEFNESAFLPLQPAATIVIPDALSQLSNAVVVEADDPSDGEDAAAVAFLAKAAKNL